MHPNPYRNPSNNPNLNRNPAVMTDSQIGPRDPQMCHRSDPLRKSAPLRIL